MRTATSRSHLSRVSAELGSAAAALTVCSRGALDLDGVSGCAQALHQRAVWLRASLSVASHAAAALVHDRVAVETVGGLGEAAGALQALSAAVSRCPRSHRNTAMAQCAQFGAQLASAAAAVAATCVDQAELRALRAIGVGAAAKAAGGVVRAEAGADVDSAVVPLRAWLCRLEASRSDAAKDGRMQEGVVRCARPGCASCTVLGAIATIGEATLRDLEATARATGSGETGDEPLCGASVAARVVRVVGWSMVRLLRVPPLYAQVWA